MVTDNQCILLKPHPRSRPQQVGAARRASVLRSIDQGSIPTTPGQVLGDVSQRLQITFNNGIHEQARIVGAIPFRHVHNIRFDHQRPGLPVHIADFMESGVGTIVFQAVVSSHDSEAQNVAIVVQNLEPLGAALCWKPRHHANLSRAPHGTVAPHGAATDEMLVRLRFVETPHNGPDVLHRCPNPLDDHGTAPAVANRMIVISSHHVPQAFIFLLLHQMF